MTSATKGRYSGVSMLLHWLIAAAVIANWRIAETAEHAATEEAGRAIMKNHFSIGVVMFVLVIAALLWRTKNRPPAMPDHFAGWEKMLAKVTHWLFYTLLLVMPLAGWFAMSKYGAPISVFGLFELPPLPVAQDPAGAKSIFESHALAGQAMLILLVLHILGTLKHTILDKDGNIFRMLPFGSPKA